MLLLKNPPRSDTTRAITIEFMIVVKIILFVVFWVLGLFLNHINPNTPTTN